MPIANMETIVDFSWEKAFITLNTYFMPVEIISGTTNPAGGKINEQDLLKMKDDFINEVDLKPYNGRTRLIKKFSVSLMKSEIINLIAFYEDNPKGIDVIKLNCAVHINPMNACNNTNYADTLTVVVEAAKFIDGQNTELGHIPHVEIGDFVVIPGYSSIEKNTWNNDDPCCPSSNP
ncbi:MAG: hypothetical protein ABIN01_19025 [Ferruginibacter sp.]